MDKRAVICILGCLCVLAGQEGGAFAIAELICAAGLLALHKTFLETKLLDFIAAILLYWVLRTLNIVCFAPMFRWEGRIGMASGIAGKALEGVAFAASCVICVASAVWLREKLGQERGKGRSMPVARGKYICAFIIMLLGEVSNGCAIAAAAVFFLLLLTDAQYYQIEGHKLRKVLVPVAVVVVLVVAWTALAESGLISLWNIESMPLRFQERLTVASSVGIAYVLLLFCDTFQEKEPEGNRIG